MKREEREKYAVWAWKERQREKGASAFKPNGERERCPVKRKGSRRERRKPENRAPNWFSVAASPNRSSLCIVAGKLRMWEWRQREDGRERDWESNIFAGKLRRSWLLSAWPVPSPYPTRTGPVPGIFFFGKNGVRRGYTCSGTPAVPVPQQYPVRVRRPNCRTRAS